MTPQIIDFVGFAAAATVFATHSMKTMTPLRIVGIASNGLFILYGYLAGAVPVFVLHLLLLPLNAWRLWHVVTLVSKVRRAAAGEPCVGWLQPFTDTRRCKAGDILFRVGDRADCMFFVVSGSFRLVELDFSVDAGGLLGAFALASQENRRTFTCVCDAPGELVVMDYKRVRVLYFQNPQFGFYLLRHLNQRLVRSAAIVNDFAAAASRSSVGAFETADRDKRVSRVLIPVPEEQPV